MIIFFFHIVRGRSREKNKENNNINNNHGFTGVPEPALSEPAQQLIGVRSGGERGHYCTTTPRFREIRCINRVVNGQTLFPRTRGGEEEDDDDDDEQQGGKVAF